MSMSPENYRYLEDRSTALIEEAKLFLDNKNVNGYILPMTCVENVISLCNRLSEACKECVVKGKNAKTEKICNKYLNLAAELEFYRKQIMERYSISG